MTSLSPLTPMVLLEDDKTRDWLQIQIMPVAWKCFRVSALYGTLAGIIASLIVHNLSPGIPLSKHALVVFTPVLIGTTFLINGQVYRCFRRQWELTAKGIRIRGWQRFTIPWKRLGRIECRPVPDLPGYTEVRAFVGKNPVSTGIIVSLCEEELRSIFESMYPQVSWSRKE